MKTIKFRAVWLPLILLLPAALSAQQFAQLTGVVTDSTGATVSGVEVKLTDTKTGAVFTTSTNEIGVYLFPKVPLAAGYTLTFNKQGFKTVTVTDVAVNVGTTSTHSVELEVGAVTETLTVKAPEEATLNTSDASIGNVLNLRRIQNLPILLRNSPAALLGLQAGVSNTGGGTNRVGVVTGARADQGNITLDGIDANDQATGQAFATSGNAPIDAVHEFRVVTTNPAASEGRSSGGQIELVTKSGTNEWHGSARIYNRNERFAANSFFNNKAGIARPRLNRNQFGGSLGGPAKKDKLFFFFDYEGRRQSSTLQILRTVPLNHVRAGQVAYINNNAGCGSASRLNTTPSCVTILPTTGPGSVASFDPRGVGAAPGILSVLASRYPMVNDPSAGDGVNTGGFRFNAPVIRADNTYTSRVDFTPSVKQRLFARWNIVRASQDDDANAGNFPEFAGDPATGKIVTRDYAYVFGHTWNLSTSSINQAVFGVTTSVLDFPKLFRPTAPNSFTFAPSPGGVATVSAPFASLSDQSRRVPVPNFRDDFTHTHGKHSIQLGANIKPIRQKSALTGDFNFETVGLGGLTTSLNAGLRPGNIGGSATARNQYDAMFAFLLGRIASVSTRFNYSVNGTPFAPGTGKRRNFHYNEYEFYAQDTWRLRSNLTLTYGLRWQYYSVPFEARGFEAINDVDFGNLFALRLSNGPAGVSGNGAEPFLRYDLGGQANGRRGYSDPGLANFGPRIGVAYNPTFKGGVLGRLFGDRKSVVRAGGSIVYDRVGGAITFIQDQVSYIFDNLSTINFGAINPATALQNDPRFADFGTLPANPQAPPIVRPFTPFVASGVPVGTRTGQTNYAVDQHFRTPYAYTFSFGFQRELPASLFLEANYVGRLGRRLFAQGDAAQIVDFRDPTSGQFLIAAFNAVQAQVNARQPITPQPWFENQMSAASGSTNCALFGVPNCTSLLPASLVSVGDLSDTVQTLYANRLLSANVGLSSQFATNAYISNLATSNYHGALVTLTKRFSNNLTGDFNYTFSHSIDNQSSVVNTVFGGLACDLTNLRVCRGNSDFDATHQITANWSYDLPVGRGQRLLGGAPKWLDYVVGGWVVSGLYSWRTGFAVSTTTGAFPVGFLFNSPAIRNGSRSALNGNLHTDPTSGNLVYFSDTTQALAALRNPTGGETGNRNNLRGPGFWSLDTGVLKNFKLPWSETHKLQFRWESFNAFNHVSFLEPNLNINSSNFGLITGERSTPRQMQFALRYDF